MSAQTEDALAIVREACLGLPSTFEKLSHGSPCFFIEKGGQFAAFVDNHHGDDRLALWLAAPQGLQEALISESDESYFRPPYVGPKGWIGVRLDRDLPWQKVQEFIELAHETILSKKRKK